MEIFWAIFASAVLIMIAAGMVQSTRRKNKKQQITDRYLSEVDDYVRTGGIYTVVLSDGRRFEKVKIVGYSRFNDAALSEGYAQIGRWLVLDSHEGVRVFLRPGAVRYFEQRKENA